MRRMASSRSKRKRSEFEAVVVVGMVMVLGWAAQGSGVGADAVTVTVENEMATRELRLDVQCRLNAQDLGPVSLLPFSRVSWTFSTSFLGGDVLACTFAALGKPTTRIAVFKGFKFSDAPCNCNGQAQCYWQALNQGFWCNSHFIQNWG